jgi:hypothetical protein
MVPATHLDVPPHSGRRDAVDGPPVETPVANRTRVVETRQLYPGYVIPLTAVTSAFLAIELAFASRLLDAIGNPISERQLAELAAWGWVLSGIALTLLVWGNFILPPRIAPNGPCGALPWPSCCPRSSAVKRSTSSGPD